MSTFVDKPLSLIEKKKQQWAREKEELAGLALPWNCTFKSIDEDSRTRNIRKVDSAATNAFIRRESISSRRQSLPPITDKTGTHNFSSNEKFEKEMGGETSGYGSDSANHVPEYLQASWNQNLGYESSSSARDDRAKWGDRGVGIGRFWDPHEIKYSPEMRDAPGWVKRGLQGDTELVVSNSSPAESPEQDYGEQRPYTSSSVSQTRTYIRGQNNPVDPIELAEREKRRQLAKAHQEAIKQQLEEREARRQLERERRIIEEREEELRIERDKEIERKRREYENQIILEKHERERKRKEALEEAIHIAEKEAQEQKRKQKMLRQLDLNISENVIEKEKVPSRPISNYNSHKAQNNLVDIKEDPALEESTRVHNDTQMNNAKSPPLKETNINRTQQGPPIEQVSPTHTITQPPSTQDNVTMVLQTPFEGYSMPFAILMPTFTPGPITPLPVATSVQTTETPRPRTENRTLTPSLYRNKNLCDSSTQTDYPSKLPSDQTKEIKYIREKLVNLDVSYDKQPKEDRNKNSERQRESHTDRPKWGANRPPTRYLKQSEKDPFYHRKKVRQKIRQVKIYDDKNNNYSPHSSDDSQTGSPRSYRTKGYIEKRRTRALWQKNGQMFSRNFRVYQTEIVPLESDKDHIYYKKSDCIKCCCNCRSQKHKYGDEIKMVDILKIEDSPREVGNDSCLPDCPSSIIDNEVLEKLNSLHNGLIMKQELWQHSPRTTSYSSPSRTNEIS